METNNLFIEEREKTMDDNTMLLERAITGEFGKLESLDPGSKEYTDTVEAIGKLYKTRMDEIKLNSDLKNDLLEKQRAAEIQEKEDQFRRDQLAEQVKDRYFKIAMGTAELLVPLIFYATWMKKGFKFEETGTFTSSTFRGLFSKFKPTKK